MGLGDGYGGWDPPEWDESQAGRRRRLIVPLDRSAAASEIDRQRQEQSRLPEPDRLPDGTEAVSDVLKRLLRDEIAPEARNLGLKGSGGKFRLDAGDYPAVLEVQRSRHNNRAVCEFTFNLAAEHRPTSRGYWWDRIGAFLPQPFDTWWILPAGADTDALRDDLLGVFRHFAVTAIQAAVDDPGFPEQPGRRWPRTFTEPQFDLRLTEASLRQVGRLMSGLPPEEPFPASFDEVLARAMAVDFAAPSVTPRSLLLARMIDNAPPGDPRCLPVLLAYLANEPNTELRGRAARATALLSVDQRQVLPHLRSSGEEDGSSDVRLSARYAMRLIERRVPRLSTPAP